MTLSETSLCAQLLSHVQIFATPWTVALQAPLSMEFSRQEYWSGLPFPRLGDLPNPVNELVSPAPAGRVFTIVPPGKHTTQEVYLIKTWLEGMSKQFLAKDFFPVVILPFN